MTTNAVTVGNFDGVHRGHQALVDACRGRATCVTAMFFDPHPGAFFRPDAAPPLLTVGQRRQELLRHAGADTVETRAFDARFASQSPEEFVRDVLLAELNATTVVVGPDFRFGQGRAGDVSTLQSLGETLGFEVVIASAVSCDAEDDVISSTRVRDALVAGDAEMAASLLGHLHDVDGTVVKGDGRGRTIGVPTANLDQVAGMLPSDGVYSVLVTRAGESARWLGVANLGVRPTFGAGRSLEVHLLDEDEDLYGVRLRVGFVARVRGETKFSGIDELVAQIARDKDLARHQLLSIDPALSAWL